MTQQLELDLSPVCEMTGCKQDKHFLTIRALQRRVAHLEKYARHHDSCAASHGPCICGLTGEVNDDK